MSAHLIRQIASANPKAKQAEIAAVLGVSRQYVHQILQQLPKSEDHADHGITPAMRYQHSVAYVRRVIHERGRIWEGARCALEAGQYKDPELQRMLDEGVLVPSEDPKGGYVLPERQE